MMSCDGGFDEVLLSLLIISWSRAISTVSALMVSTNSSFDNWYSSSSLCCRGTFFFMQLMFSYHVTSVNYPRPESLLWLFQSLDELSFVSIQ